MPKLKPWYQAVTPREDLRVKADTHSSEGDWGVPDTRLSAGRACRQSDTHLWVA